MRRSTRLSSDRKKSKVIHVFTYDASDFRVVKNDVEKLDVVESWFSVDLYHFQRYLFSKTFAPSNKVEAEWDNEGKLAGMIVLDDSGEVRPPPFTSMLLDASMERERLTPDVWRDPVKRITLQSHKDGVETLEGCEADVLARLSSRVSEADPDFLVVKDCEENLRYIFERARILGVSLQLGREPTRNRSPRDMGLAVRGRAVVDLSDFLEYGVAGISELSRFTLAPPTYSKWPAGKRIDARQSFEALKKGILVPKRRAFPGSV